MVATSTALVTKSVLSWLSTILEAHKNAGDSSENAALCKSIVSATVTKITSGATILTLAGFQIYREKSEFERKNTITLMMGFEGEEHGAS